MAHWPLAFSKARLRYRTVSFQGTPKLLLLCFYKAPSEPSYLPRVGLGRGWLGGRRRRLSPSGCPRTAPIKESFSAPGLWEIWGPRAQERAGLSALQLRAARPAAGRNPGGRAPNRPARPGCPGRRWCECGSARAP